MLLRDVIKWFTPPDKWRPAPRDYRNDVDWRQLGATPEERLLMKLNVCATPDDARRILARNPDLTPYQIARRRKPPKRWSFKRQLIKLIRNIERHDSRDPYKLPGWFDDRV